MRRPRWRGAAPLACLLALLPVSAAALDPGRRLSQYPMDRWQAEQGLPQSSVLSLAQTPEGYLWLATNEGLVRFDGGLGFAAFGPDNTPALGSRLIHAVTTTADGTLWFGTTGGGFGSLKDGAFRPYALPADLPAPAISTLAVGAGGSVWVGTYGEGLLRLQPGPSPSFSPERGLPGSLIVALAPTSGGDVWVATKEQVGLLSGDRFTALPRYRGRALSGVVALLEDRAGTLWLGSTTAGLLRRTPEGRLEAPPWAGGLAGPGVTTLLEDREGSLWIATTAGELHRFARGRLESLTPRQGLPGSSIRALLEDPAGNLWAGTQTAGLLRLRNGPFATVSTQEGLSSEYATGLVESPEGGLWVATHGGGVDYLHDDTVRHLRRSDGLSTDDVFSLLLDRDGTLWIGTDGGGICRLRKGRLSRFGVREGLASAVVYALYQDRSGATWIGTNGAGLYRFASGKLEHFGRAEGLPNAVVHVLLEDRRGVLWIGTEGGLSRLEHGRFLTFTTRDGLAGNLVLALHEDEDGRLWTGSAGGGLGLLHEGRFQSVTGAQGLFDDTIMHILPDGLGHLWMTSNRGVFRASRQDLLDVAAGRRARVACVAYGRSDGMKSAECNGAFMPAGARLRDGRLCFPTIRGVVFADPRAAEANRIPPTVLIERVRFAGTRVDRTPSLSLPLGVRQFEVRYTGLSHRAPEGLTFRYKLEGSDVDWVQAGARRDAYYTNLSPGDYVFRVLATSADGVSSTRADEIRIVVPARFHETPAFAALVLLALGLLLALGYRARVTGLRRRQDELEREVEARTRELRLANGALAERSAELERLNVELERLSTEDALTGLANRRQFDARLAQEWRRAERTGTSLALVNLDVDYFKEYNDAYGHPEGDACLQRLGALLREMFARATDLPARLGGDEFSVVLSATTFEEAERRAETLRHGFEALAIPNRASHVSPVVTLSVGAAVALPGPGLSAEKLLSAADQALYKAKELGKNRACAMPLPARPA